MTDSRKTAVLVPAYNEEKTIHEVVTAIVENNPGMEVVVIDDGSTDKTPELAKNAGATVLSHIVNLGYGAALQTGYKYALVTGIDCTVQMDGDGQHDPRFVKELVAALNDQTDVIIGSRFLENLGNYQNPKLRSLGMMFFRFLIYLFIRRRISDPTSGFQALNQQAFRFLSESVHYPADFPDADIIILLHYAGFNISEIPVAMYRSETGKSMHSGIKPIYYIAKMLLSIYAVLLSNRVKNSEESQ